VAVLDLGSADRLTKLETTAPLSPSLDGVVDGTAKLAGALGAVFGRLQNGRIGSYAGYATLILGLLALLLVL